MIKSRYKGYIAASILSDEILEAITLKLGRRLGSLFLKLPVILLLRP